MRTTTSSRLSARYLAMTAGLLLGAAAATLAPNLAHANTTASQQTLNRQLNALPDATPEQLAAAERVLTGRYACEFGKHVSVNPSAQHAGYFNLQLDRKQWVMKPVLSSTGAVRLEDMTGNTMLIQILTKSMVMDRKASQRLVDGCVHDVQRAAEADLLKSPRPSLLGPSGN